MEAKPVYYSYIRFSTPDQLKGDSLRRQLEAARAYVQENGGVLDEEKTFKDLGVSAYRGANVKDGSRLGAFLAGIETGKIKRGSVLIVEALDRISRNEPMEQLEVIRKIVKAGITIVTLFDGREYSWDNLNNDLSSLIILQTLIVQGHSESKKKSRRLAEVWLEKRRHNDPMTGRCPAWLQLVNLNGKKEFRKIVERCKIVELIFQLAARGKGKIIIAKELNRKRVESWGTGKNEKRGQKTGWYPSYVKKILNNRAVLGEFQPHAYSAEKKRVPQGAVKLDYFPPIISEELFYSVHGQRKKNVFFGGRHSETVSNLFSNLAKCGYCDAPMHFKNHGKWKYLVCSRAKRGLPCSNKGWSYPAFEQTFLCVMEDLGFSNVFNEAKDKNVATLELNLALNEGLKSDAIERQARLKSLLKENPSKSFVDALGELDAEVDRYSKAVRWLSSGLALARKSTVANVSYSACAEKIEQPVFRAKLKCELRKRIKALTLFAYSNGENKFWTTLENGTQIGILSNPREPMKFSRLALSSSLNLESATELPAC